MFITLESECLSVSNKNNPTCDAAFVMITKIMHANRHVIKVLCISRDDYTITYFVAKKSF